MEDSTRFVDRVAVLLNCDGELISWVIVESHAGSRNVRAIAAVKGTGVLWPEAGTLREVFSTPEAEARAVVYEVAWEAAIQKVLAVCKEFNVPCGVPSSPDQIEPERRTRLNC
jgi:2-keto-3-deoxy-L-rhamnonate aldolase RhmA